MSLAVLADHMASKGRGPDSMLIHMSPREVQGLQALAENHGGSLTINPETGLPEAGFLDKLLPTIIGFALAPMTAGTSLAFLGATPMASALTVGGLQTLRTGDIGKGISAGLGAYGGAGLSASLAGAGGNILSGEATALAAEQAGNLAAEQASQLGVSDAIKEQMIDEASQATARVATDASPFERISAGAKSAVSSPSTMGQFAKDNFKNIAYAAGPILADQTVKSNLPQTTTKPGMIRPYSYFGGQYVAGNPYEAAPTKSANGGLMGLAAGGMAGYGDGDDVPRRTIDGMAQGGMYDFAQRSEPVVRMAEGGVAHFVTGGYVPGQFDQATINAALAAELGTKSGQGASMEGLRNVARDTYKLTDAQINAAFDTIPGFNAQGKYDAADYAATSGSGIKNTQLQVDAANAANPYSAQNMAKVDVTRPGHYVNDASGNPVALTNYSPGFDINNPTALTYLGELTAGGMQDDASKYFNKVATPEQKAESTRLYGIEKARLDALDAAKAPTGLAGLNQNQNLLTNQNKDQGAGLTALIPDGASYTNRFFAERGLGFDPIDKSIDNFLATYKNQLAAMTPKQQEDAMRAALDKERMNEADVIAATGMTIAQLAAAKRADGSLIVAGDLKDVPVGSLPGGVSGAGDTKVNANGTITTKPDFDLTTSAVRKSYTDGGGSLGYTSPTFDSLKAVEDKYPLTGGSKQSYDFLMGREDYDPVPFTKTGEVMKPYVESVLGKKLPTSSKMYLFDPETKQYKINPDYAIPTYDSKGVKSTNLTNKDVTAYMDKNPSQSDFYTWATENNLSVDQIAAATGRPISEISKLYTGAKKLTGDDGKIDQTKVDEKAAEDEKANFDATAYLKANQDVMDELNAGKANFGTKEDLAAAAWEHYQRYGKAGGRKYTKKAAAGGLMAMARGGMAQQFNLGDYSDGGRLLRGPGDGVSDSIPATIGGKRPARLADGEFVVPARIVSELGNGSTEAGARKLYAMMDRIQKARRGTVGKGRVAKNSRSDKYLPA